MSLTENQREAVRARGNVLVVAGAGTGKTHTLVERCLSCLVDEQPRASLDEILMVTFTEAAAAEMRQRIRARLDQELAAHPEDAHWQEQLALFEAAQIGTLHSFCLKLIREHFYQLELDPQVSVMMEEEAHLLANETLDALLQKHYAGHGAAATAVQQLIQSQGSGWDKPVRELVLRLYHYTQTLPDPNRWFTEQLEMFSRADPGVWEQWLSQAITEWVSDWQSTLKTLALANEVAEYSSEVLEQVGLAESHSVATKLLGKLAAVHNECPNGKRTLWLAPLKKFFEEARFLSSLAPSEGKTDPLVEDWEWVRQPMSTLLRLALDFTHQYGEAKHELGVLDFHDLEQHALRLLWDQNTQRPSPIAEHWRKKLRFVFVDEYQDINAAQDQIIQALSRADTQANRFLVGDVKQSIYRFRLANPRIFQNYVRAWGGGEGTAIPLVDNFRSREGILSFVNSFFPHLMRLEVGGVAYDESAKLRFGAGSTQATGSAAETPSPCVELHLRVRSQNRNREPEEDLPEGVADVRDMEESDKEARLVALQVRNLHAEKRAVWDERSKSFRAVEWRDIAILLRSPARKVESYAKEFARFNMPLQVARGGFYDATEICDVISLLQVLDNPLQDIPLIAVLHSPLVGLTANELATIRLSLLKAHFWTALVRWKEAHEKRQEPEARNPQKKSIQAGSSEGAMLTKVVGFLERFARWRRLARQVSLSRCLEAVLVETHYPDWLLTQARGEQRQANVQRLISLAEQFDKFQRQGLFRFLRFIEAQQSAQVEPQVPATAQTDAVRLMSIHQSKGLEFPVVVVADLGKAFNSSDLQAEIILDEKYGLCPQIKPPHSGSRYPSLPYWLARRRQLRELLGEELRLLYVAMTRARDRLILSCGMAATQLDRLHQPGGEPELAEILSARSYGDWIRLWFSQSVGPLLPEQTQGQSASLQWHIHDELNLAFPGEPAPVGGDAEPTENRESPTLLDSLQQKLSWRYPSAAATLEPAKTSVSELRRRAAEVDEDTSWLVTRHRAEPIAKQKASGTDIGNAHHLFLQLVALELTTDQSALKQEAARLQENGVLSREQVAQLDFGALTEFWNSKLGADIRKFSQFVRRELAFTARFTPEELSELTGISKTPDLRGEFVVVQGVADLVVVLPDQIHLIDFKTDTLSGEELAERVKLYAPQMRLYARALARIYQRPVTGCWLCFLSARKQLEVGLDDEASRRTRPGGLISPGTPVVGQAG